MKTLPVTASEAQELLAPLMSFSHLALAVSGGPDSLALMHLVARWRAGLAQGPRLNVLTVDHGLRPDSRQEAELVRRLAKELGLPHAILTWEEKEPHAGSFQERAREARYALMTAFCHAHDIPALVTAHMLDDQAETFLLKLIRGAGLTGLGGIYPRREALVRPLLHASRRELRDYLAARGESWVDDESNADLANARSRVRHRVIPELDAAYGGPTTASIARAADLAREDGAWLSEVADKRYRELASIDDQSISVPAAELAAEPGPIRRRLLRRALRDVAGVREVALEHVDAAADILNGSSAGADLPAARLELRRGKLVLVRKR